MYTYIYISSPRDHPRPVEVCGSPESQAGEPTAQDSSGSDVAVRRTQWTQEEGFFCVKKNRELMVI
jgi:hypothetical protein